MKLLSLLAACLLTVSVTGCESGQIALKTVEDVQNIACQGGIWVQPTPEDVEVISDSLVDDIFVNNNLRIDHNCADAPQESP